MAVNVLKARWFWSFLLSAACLLAGYFLPGASQGLLYAFGGAFLSDAIARVTIRMVPWKSISRLCWPLLVGAGFYTGWWLGHPHIHKYPADGMIADFNGGAGGSAYNVFNGTFSVIVDSDLNEDSKCWYKRISVNTGATPSEGNGFLRVYFQLIPKEDSVAYAGVYTDFTHPPSQPLDVSRFSSVKFRLRMGQTLQESDVRMVVVLCTANVQGSGMYDYAECQVPEYELQTTWVDINAPFSQMKGPPWSSRRNSIRLDPSQAFRICIVVKGKIGAQAHGYFDVDDIRFSK